MVACLRLGDLLQHRLDTAPASVAFINADERINVLDFAARVDRTVGWLRAQGMGAGDVVAVWMVNRLEWVALLFAAARIGAVVMSVNTRYRSEELTHILQASGARLLVTHGQYRKLDFIETVAGLNKSTLPALQAIALLGESRALEQLQCQWPLLHFAPDSAAPDGMPDASSGEQLAILFTTSGTTKAPKLVMHPQRTLADHARRCAAAYGLDAPGAALLAMLPLCGVFGLNSVLAAFAGGAPVVLQEVFEGSEAARLLRQHEVTHTFGSDEMFRRLVASTDEARPFPAARMFGFGAFTSSFNDFAVECWQRVIPLHGLYGSSEVLALFSAQPTALPLQERLEGGGRPVAGELAGVRIRDGASGELLPPGASGEIEIRSPSNFIGYYRDEAATREAVREGWFRTGDLGRLRSDGTFVFESRMGDAMRLGGHLVSPAEIEESMKKLPGIADAHVVSLEILGRPRVFAFAVPQAGSAPSAQALIDSLRHSMASFKVPERIWFVDSFPQTQGANGAKTSRVKLRQMAQQRLAAEATVGGTA